MNHKIEGQPLQRFMFVIVFGLLLLMGSTRAFGAAEVVRGKLVSVTQSGPHSFDYTYALVVSNGAPALNSATITASTRSKEIHIVQGQVSLGPVAADSQFVTNGTIVLQVEERDDDYFEELSFLVVPGPGPVAEAQIIGATGGTLRVTDPGDPLLGSQITIPPGALSDDETITIGYSASLPGPLPTDAVAAGQIPVTPTIVLSRTGTAPFLQPVTVTIPYGVSLLGPGDFPAVIYWEPTLGIYQPVKVVSVDQNNGFVTFVTAHFSFYGAVGIKYLTEMLQSGSYSPAASYVTSYCPNCQYSFSPVYDGFEISNFKAAGTSATLGATFDGQCLGMTSYAAWYYMAQPSGGTHLYQQYTTQQDQGVPQHLPEEDALPREIVASAQGTGRDFPEVQPVESASDFINGMYATHSPQLAYLATADPCLAGTPCSAHSVLIYGWNGANNTFSVYDPNHPWDKRNPQDFIRSIVWQPGSISNFSAYNDVSNPKTPLTFPFIHFDAYSLYFLPNQRQSSFLSQLQQFFSNVENGLPPSNSGWLFDTLTIATVPPANTGTAPYPGGPTTGPSLMIDPQNGTLLSFTWNCRTCVIGNYYLHVFQNNVELPGSPFLIFNIALGATPPVTLKIAPLTAPTAELFAFVSSRNFPNDTGSQADIRSSYAGYQRVELTSSPISAVAGATTDNLTVNTAMTPFKPFTSVTGGTLPYAYSLLSGSLPVGLGLNAVTGAVTGTPTAVTSGTTVTFSVADATGEPASVTSTVTFVVSSQGITAVAGATTDNLTVNTAMAPFSPFTSVTGGTPPYTYILSGSLPAGLGLNVATGVVTGTPTAAGAEIVTFSVADSTGQVASVTNTVTFVVTQPCPIGSTTCCPPGSTTCCPPGTITCCLTGSTSCCPPGTTCSSSWTIFINQGVSFNGQIILVPSGSSQPIYSGVAWSSTTNVPGGYSCYWQLEFATAVNTFPPFTGTPVPGGSCSVGPFSGSLGYGLAMLVTVFDSSGHEVAVLVGSWNRQVGFSCVGTSPTTYTCG